MSDHRFHGSVERLRSPERLAALDVDRVLDWSLEGIATRTALDVGTGSGIFAELLAGGGVASIDVNPDMIAAAGDVTCRRGAWVAPAEALPFPDASFDLVFLGLVLHEADDALKMLQEARRVCRHASPSWNGRWTPARAKRGRR